VLHELAACGDLRDRSADSAHATSRMRMPASDDGRDPTDVFRRETK
jgi:hypothetical protein